MSRQRQGAFSQRDEEIVRKYQEVMECQSQLAAIELAKLGLASDVLWRRNGTVHHFEEERDESGHYPDGDPLRYATQVEAGREDGIVYQVTHRQVAIRKGPSLEGKVIGCACRGEKIVLFDWDSSHGWRRTHFRLQGGCGSLVHAWVMTLHPDLGPLLEVVSDMPEPAPPTCSCGRVFASDGVFCSACGARRPEDEEPAQESLRWPSQQMPPRQPRGWLSAFEKAQLKEKRERLAAAPASVAAVAAAAGGFAAVAEGNMLPLSAYELSLESFEGEFEAADLGVGGCSSVSSKELQQCLCEDQQEFEVVHQPFVAIRSSPCLKRGNIIGTAIYGQRVDTFGWDGGAKWRKVFGKLGGQEGIAAGWMLVSSPDVGQLLRYVDNEGSEMD